MSDKSANLKLPFIQSAQAQKHVTHNDAITNLDVLTQLTVEDKDLSTPPSSPTEGTCYIIASVATAEWAGKENQIAAWQDGAWRFYDPTEGWVAWIRDEDTQAVFDGTLWNELIGSGGGSTNLNPVTGGLLGVNATADTTNKFSVNSNATLFNHNGSDHQLKINKNANADNASVMFQTAFSGRAEFGLTGDDDFHMKVSPDGTTFHEGIVIDKDTGAVTFPNTTFSGGSVSTVFGRAGAVIATAGDYNFDEIGGVSQNVLIGRLTAGTGTQEALSAAQVRSFLNIEDDATADQTGSEIKSLLFAEADTNNFDDTQQSKLAAIEAGATADQTGAEIKALYEAEANTNAFDDSAVAKLSAIEPLADVTDEANVIASLDGATLTSVTVASDDKVIIQDLSDSDNIKSVTAQSIADLNAGNNGDVVGPSNATDFRIAMFDGATGKLIKELDAGTTGQFLKSQGDGSTPVWDNISGGGDLLSTNNLSDISNAETARNNLGLEIGVDVAAVGNDPAGVNSDLLALALRVADLEGDALGIIDGIADPFDDESDVDSTSSINIVYDALNDLYSPIETSGSDVIPTMTAATTSGFTLSASSEYNGSIVAFKAANDVIATSTSSSDIWHSAIGVSQWLKVDCGSTTEIAAFELTAGASLHASGCPSSFTLQGSDDNTNWTILNTQFGLNWDPQETKKFILSSPQTYRYYRINVTAVGSGSYVVVNELSLLASDTATDMTLVSNSFAASNTPTAARLLFQIKPVDTIIPNIDIIGAVSRDAGVTFTDSILVEKQTYSDGTKLYEAEAIDISGQPIGSSMKWKLTTFNGKNIECSGVILQWN